MTSAEQEKRVGQLVSLTEARIIRSHRKPPSHFGQRWFSLFLVLVVSVSGLTAGGSLTHAPSAHPQSTLAADRPAEVENTTDNTSPFVATRDEYRVSRGADRTPPSKIEIVIAYALAQRGDPYRYGAAGPDAFDCSGLVMAAFARIGVKLPHYTGALIGYGRRVSRSAMQRGDIVFLASHHVGIYLGGGLMIVAPHTGSVVRVQTVYAFYAARRIVG
jgi:cell wall-associated NlpC family hydrolase